MWKHLWLVMGILLCQAAFADRIVLIYGDVLEGEIVSETDATITFRGAFGERTLMRSDIREVQSDSAAPAPPAAQPAPAPAAPAAAPPPAPLAANPTPYEILKRNVEMQSQWNDLEIAYLQRSYIGGQTIQTQYIARIIPPDYLRANLTTPIPSTPQFPGGGEVEYDMYRAKTKLFQVVKMPDQPIQYLKLDLARIEGINPGDNPVEAFKKGFAGAGPNENLLQAIARNSAIVGVENTDGHDCWVIETVNTPDLVEAQVANQPAEIRERLRQELSHLGRIRSWVGKEDLIQWRMENYSRDGNLLLSLKMVSVKPNQNITPEQLRMKVPKGTASSFVDVTDMVAGQFHEIVQGAPGMAPIPTLDKLQGGTGQPYQSNNPNEVWPGQSSAPSPPPAPSLPQLPPQAIPQQAPQYPQTAAQPAYPQVPQQAAAPPQMPRPPMQQPVVYQQPVAQPQQVYPQQAYAQQPYPQQAYPQQQMRPGQPFTQSYIVGGPQGMNPQQQAPMMMPMQQQQQRSGGSFLSRLFGGGGRGQAQQGFPMPGGMAPSGNQTMMMPVVNGQPQLPGR